MSPTGYTYSIKDGISFETFIMKCARAFGACIELKEESENKEIPERFEPSPYHLDQLKKIRIKLVEYGSMLLKDACDKAMEEFDKEVERKQKDIQEKIILKESYGNMLVRAQAWNPPTSEHIELRNFMISQIEDSIKWDCSYISESKIKELNGREWLDKEIDSFRNDIKYHEKEYEKEVSRMEGRNKWLKDLRESL